MKVAGVIPRGMGASSAALEITAEDKASLARLARPGKTEQRIAPRARIVLGAGSGSGKANNALAKELKHPARPCWTGGNVLPKAARRLFMMTVRAVAASGPLSAPSKQAGLIARTQAPPPPTTQWSCRRMAFETGLEMDFGRETAPGAPGGFAILPPFAPAAGTCARMTVLSNICTRCARSLKEASASKKISYTPLRLKRQKRFQMLFQEPDPASSARHVMLWTVK
jgi:hypothetical protein